MNAIQKVTTASGLPAKPLFDVHYDRRANCLTMRVAEFWTPEDVADFAREVEAKARSAKAVRPDFDACVESLDFPVQAMDVADLLSRIMVMGMQHTTGRAAVVVGSQLNKLQAERTLAHPRLRVFVSVEQAQQWLSQTAGG